jgi:SPP1 gp7 family putative phage head morphogenesis protein
MPLPATEAALLLFARRLLARAGKDWRALLSALPQQEPVLARLLRDAILHAYVTSAKETARPALPRPVVAAGTEGSPLRPPFGPRGGTTGAGDDGDDGPIRYPGLEAAANWLRNRRLVTADEFRELSADAQRAAFTVARTATLDAVERVRGAVVEAYEQGGTLKQFRAEVKDALDESMLSPARVETLYRTHVGQAQAAGQRAVLDRPLVGDEFPYLLFSATHDSRTRPTHLEMEKWGQNGTAVYRRDDPIWDELWPPMEWNCRCVVIPLSLEDAAEHGSLEARRWLKTGVAPVEVVWAKRPYPVTPPDGWPSHRGIVAVV